MGSEGESKERALQNGYAPLDDFRTLDTGAHAHNLKNLYVYFWRWGTWKVFDANQDDRDGIVCFISTSGYVGGPGFAGMREYLRRTCSEGWIIDVSPEGIRPDVSTRFFPGVQQPLAIGLFGQVYSCDTSTPAPIDYTAVKGHRAEKYTALSGLTVDDGAWRDARTDWQAPFTLPRLSVGFISCLGDLLPWTSPAVREPQLALCAVAPNFGDAMAANSRGKGNRSRRTGFLRRQETAASPDGLLPFQVLTRVNYFDDGPKKLSL